MIETQSGMSSLRDSPIKSPSAKPSNRPAPSPLVTSNNPDSPSRLDAAKNLADDSDTSCIYSNDVLLVDVTEEQTVEL